MRRGQLGEWASRQCDVEILRGYRRYVNLLWHCYQGIVEESTLHTGLRSLNCIFNESGLFDFVQWTLL